MDEPHDTAQPPVISRIRTLRTVESELVHNLERCIPPVDQHRRELERVRSELSTLESTERDYAVPPPSG
ncbi:MAG TPA: hypothetical protein VLA29_09315 [Acidimicrobiia bacterium]|nr:hypothetical protein [Acidimicrobiia bacterium]